MTTNLSQYNEGNNNMIELIICNNDGMAEGAVAALNDKGYNTGDPAKTIPVFGVDATDAAKKLIADGKMVVLSNRMQKVWQLVSHSLHRTQQMEKS